MSVSGRITDSALYRAVWRWHFYAGLIVLPFLVMMAVTGGAYLFKPEISHFLYRSMEDVTPRASTPASATDIVRNTEQALDGRVLQLTLPARSDRSAKLIVRVASGATRTAYVDPYDGRFLGSTPYGGLMQTIRKIHSLQKFGFWASTLIEITAGWAIVLVGTGIFLWWPRGRKSGVVTVRGKPSTRTFWRDTHAVTGVFAGAIILFLAVTGMPWSMFWGKHVQDWATAAHLSHPEPPATVMPAWLLSATVPGAPHEPHDLNEVRPELPWAMEQANTPASHADGARAPIGIDAAVGAFEKLGLKRPYGVAFPEGPSGAYTATYMPAKVEHTRTVYLDQYTGKVIGDVGYDQYGPAAKAIEWGIAVHQGAQYGPLNRYLMLAGCIAIVLMAISAVMMWWKRRPKGRLGAPPAPQDKRAVYGVFGVVGVAGVVFPLVGASIAVFLGIDLLVRRLQGARAG